MNFNIDKITRRILAFGDPLSAPDDAGVDNVEANVTQAQMNKLNQPGEKTLSADGQTIVVTAPSAGAGALPARPTPVFSDDPRLSKLRLRTILTTDASGAATWTFPTPFPAGVVPVIGLEVEAPANATVCYQAHISGSPTNTSVSVKAFKPTAATIKIVALGDVNLVTTPGAVRVHITAEEPS